MVWAYVARLLCSGALLVNGSIPPSAKTVAVFAPGTPAKSLQLTAAAPSLTFEETGPGLKQREASTVLRISANNNEVSALHPVQVLVAVSQAQAMQASGRGPSLDVADLRIRDDHGEWAALQPLQELNGRFGVRIAIVRSAPATCLLQVQLHLSAGQRPGDYRGLLTVEAQEQ